MSSSSSSSSNGLFFIPPKQQQWCSKVLNETRYLIVTLLCLTNLCCYAARMNISIAVPYFIDDKGERGIVLSAFFYGYICTQIPAGYLSSKFGVKTVLAWGILIWTICDASTVIVADYYYSIKIMILIRAGVGLGQGVLMSSLHIFAANWFPMNEQTTLVAIVSSGTDLGTIVALLLSPRLVGITKINEGGRRQRWETIYFVFSTFTFLLWLVFIKHVTSKPEDHPAISLEEKERIVSTRRLSSSSSSSSSLHNNYSARGDGEMTTITATATTAIDDKNKNNNRKKNIPWGILLTNRYLWVIYISHFSANYGWYVLLGWLPTYLNEELDLELKEHPFIAAAPYICGYVGLMIGGRLSDYLITKVAIPTLHVRRYMNSIGSFLPALFLYLLPYAKTQQSGITILCFALFTGRFCTSGFWISMIDVGPDYAGQIMGISNAIGTLPGIFGNILTGIILKETTTTTTASSSNWELVFHVASFVCVIGGVIFALFSTDRNVLKTKMDDEEDVKEEEMTSLLRS